MLSLPFCGHLAFDFDTVNFVCYLQVTLSIKMPNLSGTSDLVLLSQQLDKKIVRQARLRCLSRQPERTSSPRRYAEQAVRSIAVTPIWTRGEPVPKLREPKLTIKEMLDGLKPKKEDVKPPSPPTYPPPPTSKASLSWADEVDEELPLSELHATNRIIVWD